MEPQDFDEGRVIGIVRRNVSSLPIYREGQRIASRLIAGEQVIWACYAPIPHAKKSIRTSFHLNFEDGICYLVEINLAETLRGRGIGEAMYRSVEGIAKEMGCEKIMQTASGWTLKGETRRDYLKRKFGYANVGLDSDVGEVEKILV